MTSLRRGNITAHIHRIVQDNPGIITVGLTEAQVLELISALTVGLREGSKHRDGTYHLAVWKTKKVAACRANPPCGGGVGSIQLVRASEDE